MPCPLCGRAADASTPPCPHCPPDKKTVVTLAPTETTASASAETPEQNTAVDPEVLPPEDGHAAQRGPFDTQNIFGRNQAQGHNQSGSFRFAVWHGASSGGAGGAGGPGGFGGMGMGRSSCLPGCITLFLTLVCAVQFGILGALGFLVFHLIGSGMVLALNLRQIMQGQPAHFGLGLTMGPWVGRLVIWGGSWALVGWLSGGF